MHGCACEHSVAEHGSPATFGQHICLVAGCTCNGTVEEVVTAAVQRVMAKRRTLHDLTDVVRNAACGLPDAMAYDVAVAILDRFNCEAK